MYFATAQILFAMWAAWFAHFQVPILKAKVIWIPVTNPFERPFHRRGETSSVIVASIILLAFFELTKCKWQCSLLAPSFYAIYKILFDGVIGQYVYGNFYYLGKSSKQDRWIAKRMSGKKKVIICAIIIAAVNLLNLFLP